MKYSAYKLNKQVMMINLHILVCWEIDGETMESMTDFGFLASKIAADGDCSHKIKRRLLLGRKVMTNLSSVQSLSCV